MTVSDVLLEILAAHGVKHLFGIPGDAINDVMNALNALLKSRSGAYRLSDLHVDPATGFRTRDTGLPVRG